jgi:hypothetical protein
MSIVLPLGRMMQFSRRNIQSGRWAGFPRPWLGEGRRHSVEIAAAGRRVVGLKSVPRGHATGSSTSWDTHAGIPSSSATSAARPRWMVVQADPRPRARSARQKLQAACSPESNRPGRPLQSCVPQMVTRTRADPLEVLGQIGCR